MFEVCVFYRLKGVRPWRVLLFNDLRIKLTNHATCWSDKFLLLFLSYTYHPYHYSIYNIGLICFISTQLLKYPIIAHIPRYRVVFIQPFVDVIHIPRYHLICPSDYSMVFLVPVSILWFLMVFYVNFILV